MGRGLLSLLSPVDIVGPQEMGVRVRVGSPIRSEDSGLKFKLPLFERIVTVSQETYHLNYVNDFYTKSGKYGGIHYGVVPVKVTYAFHVRLPRNDNLIEILRTIGLYSVRPPETVEVCLQRFCEKPVADALRRVVGSITWRQIIGSGETLKNKAEKILKEAEDNPIKRARIEDDDMYLTIAKIDLPSELKEKLQLPDLKRLEAEVADQEAYIIATETVGAFVRMKSEATGRTLEEVRSQLDTDPGLQKELLDLLKRRMAIEANAFTHIVVDGAEGFEKALLNLIAAWQRMPGGGQAVEKKEQVSSLPGHSTDADDEELDAERLPPDEQEVVSEAERRGMDPREPLRRWRNWKKKKEEMKRKKGA